MKKLLAITAALLVGASVAGAELRKAPDFTAQDLSGRPVSLSANKGKVVFVDFWASWCPPCRQSIPAVEALYNKMGSQAVFIGMNLENDAQATRRFAQKNGMSYPIVSNANRFASSYGVSGIPAFFIIDTQGNIVKSYAGYAPGMEAEWEQVIGSLSRGTADTSFPLINNPRKKTKGSAL